MYQHKLKVKVCYYQCTGKYVFWANYRMIWETFHFSKTLSKLFIAFLSHFPEADCNGIISLWLRERLIFTKYISDGILKAFTEHVLRGEKSLHLILPCIFWLFFLEENYGGSFLDIFTSTIKRSCFVFKLFIQKMKHVIFELDFFP